MANYTSTANVVLSVNGKQAQKMLSQLEKDAKRLEKQMASAATAGDKATMKKLQRELKSTQRMMDQLKGSSASVDSTLRRLDKATPKELNKALKLLQQQLNGIQRGSAAWDAHVAKIKAVKDELHKVNATLSTQKSMWSRMNTWLNNAQTAIIAFVGGVTGLVMAGRKAVQSYADMEEQMANTQKYTRMTAAEVEELNEIFKGMDTRLAREQLNLLAQEGGRLGYNTIASVKEYVEAASIINVALVDLGEGATQTIAKLSNIFGLEQMYGVRDAMLKVGSTVNHLSQNCTAAKPFIVEFAQRMAGIGSTAKMTVPEIMAFAATLDAHGQKVEMSATALQRTIMELFKKPAEMARKVGLETNTFIETLNKSTTQGVMMFLEALNKLGEDKALAVLSPLFQDLGLDGARVSSVLSNLSSHLDFLKWQLGEAAQAFNDGTSASNEYAIFNNTVQASIDKARKRVGELAIELGEKLYPLMKHIYTSSSAFLRVLNAFVDFIAEHKRAIITLTAALVAYNTAMLIYNTRTAIATKTTALFNGGLNILKKTLPVFNLLFTSLTNSIQYFTNGLQVNYAMQERWRKAMNGMKFANWTGLILAVASAVYLLCTRINETTKAQKAMKEIETKANEAIAEQIQKIRILQGVAEDNNRSLTDRYNAIKELRSIMADYNGDLSEEGRLLNHNTGLIDKYIQKLQQQAIAKATEEKMTEVYKQIVDQGLELLSKTQSGDPSKQDIFKKDLLSGNITQDMTLQSKRSDTLNNRLGGGKLGSAKDISNTSTGVYAGAINVSGWSSLGGLWTSDDQDLVKDFNDNISLLVMLQKQVQSNWRAGLSKQADSDTKPVVHQGLYDSDKNYKSEVDDLKNWLRSTREVNMSRPDFEAIMKIANNQYDLKLAKLNDKFGTQIRALENKDEKKDTDYEPYVSEKDRKKREREEKYRKIKEKAEFKKELNDQKAVYERDYAVNETEVANGNKKYSEYLAEKKRLLIKYYDDCAEVYKKHGLAKEGEEDEDYLALLKKKTEQSNKDTKEEKGRTVSDLAFEQKSKETQAQIDAITPGRVKSEEALQLELFRIRREYLEKMRDLYTASDEEYHQYQNQLDEMEQQEMLRRRQLYAQKYQEWVKEYQSKSAWERMDIELGVLEKMYKEGIVKEEKEYQKLKKGIIKKYTKEATPESAQPEKKEAEKLEEQMRKELEQVKKNFDEKRITAEEYYDQIERIKKAYEKKQRKLYKRIGGNSMADQVYDIYSAWKDFFDKSSEDGENWATKMATAFEATYAFINSGLQMATEFSAAQAEIDIANVERKYDREIELAEGNAYRVGKAEKAKKAEVAKIKSEQSKKEFAMKVIQAIADTAMNALKAYGSLVEIPIVGPALAAAAAAMATAQGMVQIALLKKQQQAADAQGYAEGGFTQPGGKYDVAGVVHAGEWVASQELVNSPTARPLINALDYAQRTNTIGSLRASDVSRAITAPVTLAASSSAPQAVATAVQKTDDKKNTPADETMRRLVERLNQPFVTVNTVTGDSGIKKAQDEYETLMRNKSPKSRK